MARNHTVMARESTGPWSEIGALPGTQCNAVQTSRKACPTRPLSSSECACLGLQGLGVRLPPRFQPSPLDLVIHPLVDGVDRNDFELGAFEFLEFDAY